MRPQAVPAFLVLALLAAAFTGPTAAAADVGVELLATYQDDQPAFVRDGEANPTLTFAPGDDVTITVTFDSAHNLRVDAPIDQETPIQSSGSESLTFTIPPDFTGDIRYVCELHPGPMTGTIRVAGDADGGGDDAADGTQDEDEAEDGTPGDGDGSGSTGGDDGNATDDEGDESPDGGDASATSDEDAPAGVTVVDLTATQESGEFFFLAENGTRNPTLQFDPGEEVLVRLTVDGSHNIHVGMPVEAQTQAQTGGDAALRFTIPADFEGTIEYWCDPHKLSGMAGTIQVGTPTNAADSASPNDGANAGGEGGDDTTGENARDDEDGGASAPTPAPGLLIGVLAATGAAAALGRRRARG